MPAPQSLVQSSLFCICEHALTFTPGMGPSANSAPIQRWVIDEKDKEKESNSQFLDF